MRISDWSSDVCSSDLRDVAISLWQRAWIFLRRAGTIIAFTTVVLWLLLSFPKAPADSELRQVDYSVAGRIASGLETVVRPIGFNHDIALALIPRSEEHTSELQSLMRNSYAVFCLKKQKRHSYQD